MENEVKNKLVKRIVFRIDVHLVSPLSVSSGENEWTDSDLLRDKNGRPFVAGSSLAGAMRAYLEKDRNDHCLFGYSGKDDSGRMSSLFISDMIFIDKDTVSSSVRDGVKLTTDKVAESGSKYEIEILNSGAKAFFYTELVVRENDCETEMRKDISRILSGFQSGEIRLGSKKTRGFGEIAIDSVKRHEFTRDNYCEYKDVYSNNHFKSMNDEKDDWFKISGTNNKMIHIAVPLKMEGGISIRQYAAKKNEPDFVHITDGETPVIPGSSFAGAIRHRMKKILQELQELQVDGFELPMKANEIIDIAFGYVDGEKACSSNIIINEAKIQNATSLIMTRTGISRFEAAAKKGALYTEKTYVNGTFTLNILVRKGPYANDQKWIVGLLLLAIKDLQNGLLAVGGQTAIGRGVFSAAEYLKIDGESGKENEYIAASIANLQSRKEQA